MTDATTPQAPFQDAPAPVPAAPAATPAPINIRSTILDAQDIGEETVPVPEWGVTVVVRGLSAETRNNITLASRDGEGNVQGSLLQARMCVVTILDPTTRERVFGDSDVAALMQKASGIIDRLSGKAMQLSGLNKDNDAAKAVEAAGKVS